ncbi:MAG TPA: enoyl-CoA hydratase, partial [Rhodospirillaceae bacterium]|nr:enoyl-CoA hydratase [Rhodospirillaceae bacterium]
MTDNHNSGANEALLLRDDRDGIATLTLNRP